MYAIRKPFQVPALILLSGLLLSNVTQANVFSTLSLGAGDESNVTRGLDSPQEKDSSFLAMDFSIVKLYQINVNHNLTVGARANATKFTQTSGFDNQGLGLSLDYSYKFGLGSYAPRLGAGVSYGLSNADGDARDRRLTDIQLQFEKRLTPAWYVQAGISHQISRGKSLDYDPALVGFGYETTQALPYTLYDFEATSLFALAEYSFMNNIMLSLSYRRDNGYSISSTNQPSLHLYKFSEALYADPAFSRWWYAYRIKSTTDEFGLGLSIPTGQDSSINFDAAYYRIDGRVDLDYNNRVYSVNFVYGF